MNHDEIISHLERMFYRVCHLEERVQELETSEEECGYPEIPEDQNCLWLAKDKRGGRMYVYLKEPIEQYCETFAADDEDENCYQIDPNLFPQVTWENSPQKLVLESSISKTETVEKEGIEALQDLVNAETMPDDFQKVVDDNFDELLINSEKPNNQDKLLNLYHEELKEQCFDRQRALELVRDIENCTINNANSATKAILMSCQELIQMLGGESSISKTETVGKDVLDKLRALLSRIDKDYEENLEYSHYEEGQQDLIKEIREVIE